MLRAPISSGRLLFLLKERLATLDLSGFAAPTNADPTDARIVDGLSINNTNKVLLGSTKRWFIQEAGTTETPVDDRNHADFGDFRQ